MLAVGENEGAAGLLEAPNSSINSRTFSSMRALGK